MGALPIIPIHATTQERNEVINVENINLYKQTLNLCIKYKTIQKKMSKSNHQSQYIENSQRSMEIQSPYIN